MNKILDERGFVYKNEYGRPYWCTLLYGDPWIFNWIEAENRWQPLRGVSFDFVKCLPRNLSAEEQQVYHDKHLRCYEE
jgi:hypothetical protein